MRKPTRERPKILLHPPQDLHAYWVYEYQLQQIQDGYSEVGQDFAFAIASLSIGASFVVALLTATPSQNVRLLFTSILLTCVAVFLYTSIRWWRRKGGAPNFVTTRQRGRPIRQRLRVPLLRGLRYRHTSSPEGFGFWGEATQSLNSSAREPGRPFS